MKQIKYIKIYFDNASNENAYVSKNPGEGPLVLKVTSRKEIAELTKAIEGALDASRGSQLQLGGLSEPADDVSYVDYHGHEVETFYIIDRILKDTWGPKVGKLYWKYRHRAFPKDRLAARNSK